MEIEFPGKNLAALPQRILGCCAAFARAGLVYGWQAVKRMRGGSGQV